MNKLNDFIRSESAAGMVLMLAAIFGLIAANTSFSGSYFAALQSKWLGLSLLHWINDGLMAIFFLYVGLEVKREWQQGELNSPSKRILPAAAALGGLLLPALIYLMINGTQPPQSQGWAIPTATDIAFVLGVLALLGNRVPISLKIFVTALAIMDDLAAIVIIAVFYTEKIVWFYAILAMLVLAFLFYLNVKRVYRSKPYIIGGIILWVLVLNMGIHATLAGVLLALTLPLQHRDHAFDSLALKWEHALHYWVALAIVPIFGFANAGVSFAEFSWQMLVSPVVLGIALGLLVGKQFGILAAVFLLHKLKWARLPENATFPQIYGVALLCGIGFTMSLFISLLAFAGVDWQNQAKVGVFLGSLLSGVAGCVVLHKAGQK
ncbi:Na+/H+ antiporter NhaA [Alysiella filiformis]|uniref:Na(+)/H(+) antiporter NhaA n=1 Tax=Alysiella filiformis DSM 16848 TaxID=1120981 RepID=A0A286E6N5_9NEIS|nr:Na+/H+ antiporter NhaA [Alysiella filiformis]QMT31519.1 Na+/H+ antiporter NhaA [Alysiella filiformis]SOD66578.1 Na+:H+ antiporter, NhaA family [Alysiella filiformis DSM 16848]